MSQRDHANYYAFLSERHAVILHAIVRFFYAKVHRKFPLDTCACREKRSVGRGRAGQRDARGWVCGKGLAGQGMRVVGVREGARRTKDACGWVRGKGLADLTGARCWLVCAQTRSMCS